ncbi:MAG: hypothetical protein H7X92_09640 [Chitinophagales bacterium]|nr:hypothetical protein [Hyphomicrobiales bacterium]
MQSWIKLVRDVAVALLGATHAAQAADITTPLGGQAQLEALSGTYVSVAAENWYRGYGTRAFNFDEGKWGLTFVYALDPAMLQKVFEFHTEGPYRVVAKSSTVEGAFDTTFYEDVKGVTLRTTDTKLIEAMGLAGCNLKLNIKTDISKSGCARWKPVAQCREDHDLLAIDAAGKLLLGVRPADNDMCTPDKRPTALLPAVTKKN